MLSPTHISVVVPAHRMSAQLRECLEHLAAQTYRCFDVIVVTDEPEREAVAGLAVRFLASGPARPNAKRVQAAETTAAEILALIDDDAYPAPDWLERAVRHFRDPSVVGAGGPGVTPPGDDGAQRASGAILASPLVSGVQARRYVPRAACDVDLQPSCNFLVRRAAFIAAARTTLGQYPAEDALHCLFLRKEGKRIVYDPSAIVYHHRRRLPVGHLRQVWGYAVQRGRFVTRYPALARDPAYFVPLLFVAAHLASGAALRGPAPIRRMFLALACTYGGLVAWEARRARRAHAADPFAVALGIYLTHLAYGAGVAYGFVRYAGEH